MEKITELESIKCNFMDSRKQIFLYGYFFACKSFGKTLFLHKMESRIRIFLHRPNYIFSGSGYVTPKVSTVTFFITCGSNGRSL